MWKRHTFELRLVSHDQSAVAPTSFPDAVQGLETISDLETIDDDEKESFFAPTANAILSFIGTLEPVPNKAILPQCSYPFPEKCHALVVEAEVLMSTQDIISAEVEKTNLAGRSWGLTSIF